MDLQEQLSSRIKQAKDTVESLEQIVKYRPTIALYKGKPLTSLNIDELREELVAVSSFLVTYGQIFDAASTPNTIVYQGVDANLLVRTLFSLIDKHESTPAYNRAKTFLEEAKNYLSADKKLEQFLSSN